MLTAAGTSQEIRVFYRGINAVLEIRGWGALLMNDAGLIGVYLADSGDRPLEQQDRTFIPAAAIVRVQIYA